MRNRIAAVWVFVFGCLGFAVSANAQVDPQIAPYVSAANTTCAQFVLFKPDLRYGTRFEPASQIELIPTLVTCINDLTEAIKQTQLKGQPASASAQTSALHDDLTKA